MGETVHFHDFCGKYSWAAVKQVLPSHGGTRREEEDCKAGGGRGGLVAGRVMVRRDAEGQWPAGVGWGRERGCRRTRPHGLAAGTRARSSSNWEARADTLAHTLGHRSPVPETYARARLCRRGWGWAPSSSRMRRRSAQIQARPASLLPASRARNADASTRRGSSSRISRSWLMPRTRREKVAPRRTDRRSRRHTSTRCMRASCCLPRRKRCLRKRARPHRAACNKSETVQASATGRRWEGAVPRARCKAGRGLPRCKHRRRSANIPRRCRATHKKNRRLVLLLQRRKNIAPRQMLVAIRARVGVQEVLGWQCRREGRTTRRRCPSACGRNGGARLGPNRKIARETLARLTSSVTSSQRRLSPDVRAGAPHPIRPCIGAGVLQLAYVCSCRTAPVMAAARAGLWHCFCEAITLARLGRCREQGAQTTTRTTMRGDGKVERNRETPLASVVRKGAQYSERTGAVDEPIQ